MARTLYGASPADYFASTTGAPVPYATATVWTAITGGTQATDLLTVAGASITSITADDLGGFRFYGPDAYNTELWVQATGGGLRYKAEPVDIAVRLKATETALGSINTGMDLVALSAKVELVIRYDASVSAYPQRAVALPGVPRTTSVRWQGPVPPTIDAAVGGVWASDGYDFLLLTQGSL